MVECFARGMALTREIPLLARLAETEPELVTAAGVASHSSLVLHSAARVAATLRRAGATMPDDDLETVAELMLRVAWTFLLNPQGTLDVTDDRQVRAYARARYLRSVSVSLQPGEEGRTRSRPRMIGQVMQWPPPRPRPSSAPTMVITSTPALRSSVLVRVLRS